MTTEAEATKYKLYMELQRERVELKLTDIVEAPFDLNDYIFEHDLEAYTIVKFDMEAIK